MSSHVGDESAERLVKDRTGTFLLTLLVALSRASRCLRPRKAQPEVDELLQERVGEVGVAPTIIKPPAYLTAE